MTAHDVFLPVSHNSLSNNKGSRASLTGNKTNGDRQAWKLQWELLYNPDLVYLYFEYLAYNGIPDSSTLDRLALELKTDRDKVRATYQ